MRLAPVFAAVLVPVALAGATTAVGPVGLPTDLRSAYADAVAAGLPVAPTLHRQRIPLGKDAAGEAELSWSTADVAGGAYVTDVALAVTRPAEGLEVLSPVVLPPFNAGSEAAPVATVGVVVAWRKDSACRSEMASVTFQVDGKGNFHTL